MTRIINEFFSQLSAYFKGFRNISLTQIFNDWNIFEIVWLIASVSILAIISIFDYR
ncbi:hypothetical protein [Francisella orientalis]|uniref:hypothetical protein n=2 Tax=Francisella orientalis TaxID=299583 RepID=UPI00030532D1|nr:hypothetical protein [Francisella orientalis]AHB99120.1 hypothetical protein M973_03635 [Francisella orientalis LADL 07-285A]